MSREYCSIYSQLPRGESGRIRRGEADGRMERVEADGRMERVEADGRMERVEADGRMKRRTRLINSYNNRIGLETVYQGDIDSNRRAINDINWEPLI
jgi:hypothetical protein